MSQDPRVNKLQEVEPEEDSTPVDSLMSRCTSVTFPSNPLRNPSERYSSNTVPSLIASYLLIERLEELEDLPLLLCLLLRLKSPSRKQMVLKLMEERSELTKLNQRRRDSMVEEEEEVVDLEEEEEEVVVDTAEEEVVVVVGK